MIETFLFLALSLVQQEFANLPQFDHSIEWHTLETEHFYIHYPPSMENPAKKLSQMVEPIRKRLADKFMSAPKGRVHVVLTDFIDDSNGLSSPIPYNVIYLYAAPPPDDSSLDDYDDWLKMLFTHEFTHSVHLDMAGGINSILRSIFGRIIVPNAAQQQWGLEGLAELEETLETTRGRGRSPFVEMFLRTISLENKFLPIERATYWHDLYPYGNAAYFYGIGFYQYLIRQYGEDKIYEFTRLTSRSIVPAFFNFKTNKIFGKSFSRLWSEWAEEERAKWNAFRYEHPSSSPSKSLLPFEQRVEGQPTFDDLGTTLYVPIVDQDLKSQVRAFHLDDPTKISSEKVVDGILPPRLFFHKNFLFYSRLSFFDPFRTYSDVFALDLKTKKSHRLTKGLRLHDPLVVGNQIIAVRDDALKASIVRFPLPEDLTKSDGTPLEDPKQLEVLYHANGFDTIDKPSVSPDQKLLVFSMRREMKGRNLFLLNLGTHELRQLTAEGYDDYHPLFTPDGSHILFSSARPLENGKKDSVLVSNIFSLDLGNQKIKPVTQVLTGANWPTLGKGTLAFGHFRSTGFALQTMSYKLDAKSKNTLHPFKKINPSDNVSYDLPPNAVIRPYQKANTLWPHYILPFFFYTESDSALGITTSTFDPLQTHLWSAA
ncbi:MAG: repeat-containing protein, partial [Bacteriovoracaceae bacterium]|nr:repeat-containing protein [Bacteriovoracaceae bacterium]